MSTNIDLNESVAGEEDPGAGIELPVVPPANADNAAASAIADSGNQTCPRCGGSGRIEGTACPDCQGTGLLLAGRAGI